jgi:hypothetical protein
MLEVCVAWWNFGPARRTELGSLRVRLVDWRLDEAEEDEFQLESRYSHSIMAILWISWTMDSVAISDSRFRM